MDKQKQQVREYELKNPDKKRNWTRIAVKNKLKRDPTYYNRKVLENYYRNKDKWCSRKLTRRYIYGNKKFKPFKDINFILIKKCNQCNTLKDLELHHEIYPTKKEEIYAAIVKKRIYYLCYKCHRAKNRV